MESLPLTIKNSYGKWGIFGFSVSSKNKQTEKRTGREGLDKHLKRYITDCKYLALM